MARDPKLCPHCGAKMVEYKHGFNVALAIGLARTYAAGKPVNLNTLGLTRNQWDNYQKLRYWDLVAKAERDDGKNIGGVWVVTERGEQFVNGRIKVQSHVWTYRGERVRYEGKEIGFSDRLPSDYKTRPEYATGR